ncbi:hypothetical protein D3C75_1317310 [compost metagenome]
MANCSSKKPMKKSPLMLSKRITAAPATATKAASKAHGLKRRFSASSIRVTCSGVRIVNSSTSGTVSTRKLRYRQT